MKHSGKLAWAGVALFLLGYEAWALTTGGETLSRAMWEMTTAWPPLTFLLGFVCGGLVAHFWWRWDPTKGKTGGG
jgi:hypothetical protein